MVQQDIDPTAAQPSYISLGNANGCYQGAQASSKMLTCRSNDVKYRLCPVQEIPPQWRCGI